MLHQLWNGFYISVVPTYVFVSLADHFSICSNIDCVWWALRYIFTGFWRSSCGRWWRTADFIIQLWSCLFTAHHLRKQLFWASPCVWSHKILFLVVCWYIALLLWKFFSITAVFCLFCLVNVYVGGCLLRYCIYCKYHMGVIFRGTCRLARIKTQHKVLP